MLLAMQALHGQASRELQIHGVGVVTATNFYGAGLGVAVRSRGRTRLGLSGSIGDVEGGFGGRAALMVSYHLFPLRRGGITPYGGGGISVVVAGDSREYLVGVVGIEASPAGSRGWFVEVGFSGGLLLSGGIRFRWQ